MGFVEQYRLDVTASQIVIPALSRDPLGRRKSRGDIASSIQRLGAVEEWAPAQAPSASADMRRRGDKRVESAAWERVTL
jgi:hypothetical protein